MRGPAVGGVGPVQDPDLGTLGGERLAQRLVTQDPP